MKVPFIDLHGQVRDCEKGLGAAVLDVATSCGYVLGKHGKGIEEAIAADCGTRHAIGVASGTDALILAQQALGLKPGEKVAVPAFTFAASVSSILFAGGKPYFIDVDEHTFNMDVNQAMAAIDDVAGFIPVHLYGLPCDITELTVLAKKKGKFVLEDCAQSYGARLNGVATGSIGDAGTLSFYPTKNLSAAGDAGMVLTNSQEVDTTCRLLRNHGEAVRYYHSILGRNSRLDEIQAAVLNVKLPHVPRWNENRRKAAALYNKCLAGVGDIVTPTEPDGCNHVYNLYVVRTSKRDGLKDFLTSREIGCGVYYPVPMHKQPIFSEYASGKKFPVTDKICDEVLALPMFAHIEDAQVEYVADTVREFFNK